MWKRSVGFEIQELLGEGSQGRVFKALRRDSAADMSQTVAVKILHSEIPVELWKREFESLAKVRSPYCVQVLGFERIEQRPALVLEYVDGVSLAALGKSCWLEEDEIIEILAQAESAILDLYKYQVFHGDLSPHNILIDRDGHLRLLDFGLANCSAGRVRLTPEFAAPERLCGQGPTLAADIFSLGRVEQFLRGHGPRMNAHSSYLQPDPARRSLRGLFSEPTRQEKLAQRVREYQNRRKSAQAARTRTQARPAPRRPRALVVATITACLSLLASSRGQSTISQPAALLEIRTHHWHHFSLNGSPLGYSPVNVPIEAGRAYRLEWVSAKTRGSRTIQVQAGHPLRLSDRDFSH